MDSESARSEDGAHLPKKEPLLSVPGLAGRSATAGETRLFKAIVEGDTTLAKTLMEAGVDVKQILMDGRSPLSFAALRQDSKMVKLLLDAGVNPNEQECNATGSILAWACYRGDLETAGLLIDAESDINMQLTSGRYGSALAAACAAGSLSTVKLLLEKGADINMQLKSGRYGSALAAAIAMGQLENIRLLLLEGADASLPLYSGKFGDAITIALDSRSFDITKLLLEAGASIGPLAEAFFRHSPESPTSFVKNLEAIGISFNTFEAEYLRQTILWDPPTTMSTIQDKYTWFYDFDALIRNKDTVEFDALCRLIERYYGDMGLRLLRSLVCATSRHGQYIDGYMRLEVLPRKLEEEMLGSKSLLVSLKTTTCTPEIIEAMQLICRVIRAPSPGQICISKSRFEGDMVLLDKLLPVPISPETNNGWYGLFHSAVISLHQDIDQTISCRGLVLDYKNLLGISAVKYPLQVDSGTILMGYSTALVPIRETEDGMILWHVEIAKDEFQLRVANLEAIRHDWLRTQSLDYLQSKKALLG